MEVKSIALQIVRDICAFLLRRIKSIEIINDNDNISSIDQTIDHMRSDKTSTPGDKNRLSHYD